MDSKKLLDSLIDPWEGKTPTGARPLSNSEVNDLANEILNIKQSKPLSWADMLFTINDISNKQYSSNQMEQAIRYLKKTGRAVLLGDKIKLTGGHMSFIGKVKSLMNICTAADAGTLVLTIDRKVDEGTPKWFAEIKDLATKRNLPIVPHAGGFVMFEDALREAIKCIPWVSSDDKSNLSYTKDGKELKPAPSKDMVMLRINGKDTTWLTQDVNNPEKLDAFIAALKRANVANFQRPLTIAFDKMSRKDAWKWSVNEQLGGKKIASGSGPVLKDVFMEAVSYVKKAEDIGSLVFNGKSAGTITKDDISSEKVAVLLKKLEDSANIPAEL